jgi:hypothetical protein
MTEEKFIYSFEWHRPPDNDEYPEMPVWWCNFVAHCILISDANRLAWARVVNHELVPYGGKLISPRGHPNYLRFDHEQQFTMFVLRWA